MAEELKTTIIALLAGGFLQGFGFFVKYILARRATMVDVEETEAETRNTDADTIQKLVDTIDKLSESSSEQRDDILKLQGVQHKLVSQNKLLEGLVEKNEKQNKELVEKNDKLELSISILKDKNESLSDLVISEQKEKIRFRRGVEKLIVQMKEAGITEPAFKL